MDLFAIVAAPAATAFRAGPARAGPVPDVPVSLVMWAITAIVMAIAVRRTNRTMDERAVPLMGVMAAFIFAAQMFNFQVAGGTSGHLLGGVLAAMLLGPWAGTLVMACVIAVQALVFSDGGLVVMGANIFNMGVVGTLGGFAIYLALCRAASAARNEAGSPPSAIAGMDRRRARARSRCRWSLIVSGTTPGRDRAAGDGRRPRLHRHRRGADHRWRPSAFIAATRRTSWTFARPRGRTRAAGRDRDGRDRSPGPGRGIDDRRGKRLAPDSRSTGDAAPRPRTPGGSPASPSPPSSSSSSRRSRRRIPTASSASPQDQGSSNARRTSSRSVPGYAIPGIDDAGLSKMLAGLARRARSWSS